MGIGEHWSRSLSSKWVLFVMLSAVLIFVVVSVPDFLAVNNPVGKGILVVEAWIPRQTLAESANIFNSRHYRYLVVVGGPIGGMANESDYPGTYDDLAAQRLLKLGFDTKKLVKISVPAASAGDRTLASATAVKRWLSSSGISVCCVDVFTEGVHARKSWNIFRYAFRDGYRVGIISGPAVSYDPRFWFFSTRGIWKVVRNLAGYIYSKFWILFDSKISHLVIGTDPKSQAKLLDGIPGLEVLLAFRTCEVLESLPDGAAIWITKERDWERRLRSTGYNF